MNSAIFVYFTVFVNVVSIVKPEDNDDFLSILNGMKDFLSPDNNIADMIGSFLNQKDLQLDKLKQYVGAFSGFQKFAGGENLADLINNPVTSYLFVQRLVAEWKEIEDLLKNPQPDGESIKKLSKLMGGSATPTDEELNKAAQTVIRIQSVYDLNVTDILNGKLGEINTGKRLTVNECLRLGQQAFLNFDLDLGLIWFQEGLKLASHKKDKHPILKNAGHLKDLKNFVKSAFKLITPDMLKTLSQIPGIPTELLHHLLDKNDENNPDTKVQNTYKKLCRGEQLLTSKELSMLQCEFIPHDVTGPMQRSKVEYLSYNPLIIIIHNVMSDKEMDKVKELSTPMLEEVKVHQTGNSEDGKISTVRTGKSAWLHSDSDPLVKNFYRRVEDFTGLSTATAEPLHVVHYGIGGHYETHTDFFNLYSQQNDVVPSDRVATVLLYLSDSARGGNTVFPYLNLSVKPQKGSALFWFNLLRSGEGDFRMVHAACPVLSTSKWVANLWILEEAQTFRRPCALNQNE